MFRTTIAPAPLDIASMIPYVTLPLCKGGNVQLKFEFYEPTSSSEPQDIYVVALRPSCLAINADNDVNCSYNPWG